MNKKAKRKLADIDTGLVPSGICRIHINHNLKGGQFDTKQK
jgi:hypothetical protein